MIIEPGMLFKGNVNGVEIEILSVDNKQVSYRRLKGNTKFTVGRTMFEHCDMTRVDSCEVGTD